MLRLLGGSLARRRSRDRRHRRKDVAARPQQGKGQNPLHLVSAWAARQRLVLGQQACAEKSNEITAIPALLERLELTGALVTIDAMGCQTEIAKAIRDKGADYLLVPQGQLARPRRRSRALLRRPPIRQASSVIRPPMATMAASKSAAMPSATPSNGSLSDRRFPGEWRFDGLAMIAMVEAEIERGGKDRHRAALLSLLSKTLRQAVRRRRARPLARRKPPALGHGCRLPRRPHAPANKQRTRKHGRRQPHEPQSHSPNRRQGKPQSPKKNNRMGRRLFLRRPHRRKPMIFKRFPWLVAGERENRMSTNSCSSSASRRAACRGQVAWSSR